MCRTRLSIAALLRCEPNCRLTQYFPALVGRQGRRSVATVLQRFAGPSNRPLPPQWRCKQRLRLRAQNYISAQIDNQQSLICGLVGKVAEQERAVAKHRAVEPAVVSRLQGRFFPPQPKQVLVQAVGSGVPLTIGEIKSTALERCWIRRIGNGRFACRDAGELRQEFPPAGVNLLGQIGVMVGKKLEGRCGGKLLPLKEQRRTRTEQEQSGEGTVAAGTCSLVGPQPVQ